MSDTPPPWEVVALVCQYLNPETLALCSCVCKLWYNTMSSDQIWNPICFTHYPSLSFLFQHHHHDSLATIPFRRLYALCYVSSKIRNLRNPSKPRISMENLIFAVDIFKGNSHLVNIARQGEDLCYKDGVFRFDSNVDFELKDDDMCGGGDLMRVTWSIVMRGWTGVFMAMDCKGQGMSIKGCGERWFSQALPSSPGCCWCSSSSVISTNCNNKNGLVAELGLCFSNIKSTRKKMDKVKMGFLSVGSWRYTNMNDALLYLQHFLLHFPY